MKAGKIPVIAVLLLSFFILPDYVQAKYSGGSGSADDPYKIGTPADLLTLAADANDYNKPFILTADINLAASGPFTTAVIAPDTNPSNTNFDGTAFTGVFDGNNHTISNLTIDSNGAGNDYLGLFGKTDAGSEIKNLGLENVSITSGVNSIKVGGLVGENYEATISNCYSTGVVTGGAGSYYLGGLVGYNDSSISNCYSTGAVTGTSTSELGGLVGFNSNVNATISNSYSTGAVNGTSNLGGLVGVNSGGSISNCYSTGNVSGVDKSNQLGGLVGVLASGTISNCYSTGSVSSGDSSQYLGGLVGYNNINISNCYSTGTVSGGSGTSNIGGLAGYDGGTINSCYFLAGSGLDNGIGTSLSASNMKKQASFAGWDFVNVWRIREDVSSPKLNISDYSGGSGTAGAPYKIGTAGDLLAMAANIGDYDAYFVLTANINLASYNFTTAVIASDTNNTDWNFEGVAFTGVFDGNGYTISNLTINTGGTGNDYLGLFGKTGSGGQIKNLGLKNVSITGGNNSYYLGGLAGHNASGSNIGNCHSTGSVSGGASSNHLGGLTGDNDGNISNCYSTGTINSGDGSNDLGGLVGLGGGTISNSYSTSDVNSGDSSQYLGGLIARNWGGGATINKCYSTGTIKGGDSSKYLGGLMGFNNSGGVNNCYSTGDVNSGDSSQYLGGMMGYNFNATISNCYSAGDVNSGSGSSNIGGLAGDNSGGTINSCYFPDTEPNNGLGTMLTDKQMKQQASFVGWDFNNIWWINEKVSYPELYWQLDVTKCTVTAGSKPNKDKVSFSGTMGAEADDFNEANTVKVTIYSDDILNPFDQNFPINNNTFKKGKYNYSGTDGNIKKSFTYDVKTHKFSFSASNLNLSGLDCPVTAKIDINDFNATAELDETIVNGPTVPIPIKLMMGVKNVLRVDKCTVKQNNKKPNSDQLSVKGAFVVEDTDVNMVNEEFVVTLDSQTFTLPAGSFKAGRGKFSCSKAHVTEGGTAAGEFNFNLCSFILTIKDANIPAISGAVDFGVAFADYNEVDQFTLP